MRALALALVLVSTPVVGAERRTVGIGDALLTISVDRRENVELATTLAPVKRTIYIVDKVNLPAGSDLEWNASRKAYCALKGYTNSAGAYETGVCLADTDGDGKFDQLSGAEIVRPVKLKAPVGFNTKRGTVEAPSEVVKRIVYLGGTSTEAKFSYREFTQSGLARPAFTEDLTVPLHQFPASIALKGVRMTIHAQTSAGLDVQILD